MRKHRVLDVVHDDSSPAEHDYFVEFAPDQFVQVHDLPTHEQLHANKKIMESKEFKPEVLRWAEIEIHDMAGYTFMGDSWKECEPITAS